MDWRNRRIVAAAVNHRGLTISLKAPARHHDILQAMTAQGIRQDENTTQGFLTDHGEFVRRKPAFMIAKNAAQLNRRSGPGTYQGDELYSEDLW